MRELDAALAMTYEAPTPNAATQAAPESDELSVTVKSQDLVLLVNRDVDVSSARVRD